jgi:uncharacterized protein (TIGR02996 family)
VSSATEGPGPIEEALLAAIAAQPEAIEPRLVYADWLQAQGDPRGDLIIVQHERRARPDDAALEACERDLVERATAALMRSTLRRSEGPPLRSRVVGRWELGFVDEIVLNGREADALRRHAPGWLERVPLRMVRELDILTLRKKAALRFLADAPLARSVRQLRIGSHPQPLHPAMIAEVALMFPALRSLKLRGDTLPALDELRGFPLEELGFHGPLHGGSFFALAGLPVGLESLELRATITLDSVLHGLRPLLTGAVLPGLRRLALLGYFQPAVMVGILVELAASGRARTLDSVTLDTRVLDAEAGSRLAYHRDALAKLRIVPIHIAHREASSRAHQQLASLLQHHLGRAADAIPLYEEALRLNPKNDLARHGLEAALQTTPTRSPSSGRC